MYETIDAYIFPFSHHKELLVEDITTIIRREAVPLTFDADQRFLNFSTFGRQAPTFISMVRDPMDPQILRRWKIENKKELRKKNWEDEREKKESEKCPKLLSTCFFFFLPFFSSRYKKRDDMSPRYAGSIAYFCGQDPRCT